MERDTEDHVPTPEFVDAAEYQTGVIPLARPGVVVWLGGGAPDEEEVARAAAMRAHPAGGEPGAPPDAGPGRHLRAVS
jgi:hypothetical protein